MDSHLINVESIGHCLVKDGKIMGFYEQFIPENAAEITVNDLFYGNILLAPVVKYPMSIEDYTELLYYRRLIGIAIPPYYPNHSPNEPV